MAAVLIHPTPVELEAMTTRRVPLADAPNKLNSPFRGIAAAGGKRTRAGDVKEVPYGQPPAKKQIIEIPHDEAENIDPRKKNGFAAGEEEPFARKTVNAQPTAFEKRLASVREKKPTASLRTDSTQKAAGDNIETLRQWQRHYRKQFPYFVFYFDNIADDVRQKAIRQVQTLGAREEKFFSKSVTHVITTRQIPTETLEAVRDDEHVANTQNDVSAPTSQATANGKTTLLLEANLQRRGQSIATVVSRDVDPRKLQSQGADVLSRARGLGIKIWAFEKLQRVLKTMFDGETREQVNTNDARSQVATRVASKQVKNTSLEQMLRNEKINGPADRDMTVAARDMTEFRGYYIYVHDMDEKTKPTMVRDYNKPPSKEQGKWPQFRITAAGRCPFIEDPAHTKKLMQEEKRAKEEAAAAQRRTRAGMTINPAALTQQPRALAEREANLRRSPRKLSQDIKGDMSKPLDPPRLVPAKRQSSADADAMPALFGSTQIQARGPIRYAGGQPVASGVQPSNVTSAIRSQIMSSTAISSTAPMGRRIGDSKEVSALKRKVLERGASTMSNQSIPSSYMNDMRAALNNEREPPPRAAKRKAQETLGVVHEDDGAYHDEPQRKAQTKVPKRNKKVEKEPKPGYCENCRDKFDDFDDHIQSRKHRKFALTDDNWKELDALLCQLRRPRRD